jgi:hypothetical protein
MHSIYSANLSGKNLEDLMSVVTTDVEKLLATIPKEGEVDLFSVVGKWLFCVTSKALHSDLFEPEKLYDDFLTFGMCSWRVLLCVFGKFSGKNSERFPSLATTSAPIDSAFPLLAAGLPRNLFSKSVQALDRIHKEFARLYHATKDLDPDQINLSEIEKARRKRCFEEQGTSVETYSKVQATFLWAQQGNTLPATCWTLAYILTDSKVSHSGFRNPKKLVPPLTTFETLIIRFEKGS